MFGFQSPLSYYPRTFGTYVLEGSWERETRPLFLTRSPYALMAREQYRAISQTYSGVSAPLLDNRGVYRRHEPQ